MVLNVPVYTSSPVVSLSKSDLPIAHSFPSLIGIISVVVLPVSMKIQLSLINVAIWAVAIQLAAAAFKGVFSISSYDNIPSIPT